jgi:hypothetical protein
VPDGLGGVIDVDRSHGRYQMDYLPDPTLFKAVMFGVANTRAANYYGVEVCDVARYVGQAGGTSAQRKRRRPTPPSNNDE